VVHSGNDLERRATSHPPTEAFAELHYRGRRHTGTRNVSACSATAYKVDMPGGALQSRSAATGARYQEKNSEPGPRLADEPRDGWTAFLRTTDFGLNGGSDGEYRSFLRRYLKIRRSHLPETIFGSGSILLSAGLLV